MLHFFLNEGFPKFKFYSHSHIFCENFYICGVAPHHISCSGELDRLSETTWKMFGADPLGEEFKIEENDFVHGLPKIMNGWLHLAENILSNPPKPSNLDRSVELHDLMKKFCAVSELANKQLEKIEECTEKTPSHEQVWAQRQRMKKILQKTKTMTSRLEMLGNRWTILNESESSDNLDFQPLVSFLNFYTECYA